MRIIDMHCDTLWAMRRANSPALRSGPFHVNLEKMKQGGYLLQNFALYTDLREEKNPMEAALLMIDIFYREMEKNSDLIRPAYSYKDIIDNRQNGRMSAMLTIEEGDICLGSLSHLRNFYRLGVRMMTLTWNYENSLASPNHFPRRDDYTSDLIPRIPGVYPICGKANLTGLKEKGFAFLHEMERLGIIADVSHLSDGGFYDVLAHTRKPFVASHSNSRALCRNCRNLTDDMIRQMGMRGCVIGLNYFGNFLSFRKDGHDSAGTAADIARHARHMAGIGGAACLGLGSDFDGFLGETEISDCSKVPLLEDALKKQHFTSGEIDGIFYKNILNLYREVLIS